MRAILEADIDPTPLIGKKVAIIGYGNQGRPQALNLRDSGIDVVVGLRPDSPSDAQASDDGVAVADLRQAAATSDVVMMLVPDEAMAAVYRELEPYLKSGAALAFSHGLAIRFGFIIPRSDLDVILVAPKGPGTALRAQFVEGRGMLALTAVAQDASGRAEAIALAYGRAIGCARAGLIGSSFAEECEADLFNEHAVVWGGVPELLTAGFDTLVAAGISPEVAYLECVSELKLLADLVEQRGIAGMREAISNTAELGAIRGGPIIIDNGVKQRMREILEDVRSGRFASALEDEQAAGYPALTKSRSTARVLPVEQARTSLAD